MEKKLFVIRRIKKLYATKIECLPYVHWFNPLVTLYLNFRSFPIKQAIKLPIFVYGWPRLFSLFGSMECVGMCRMGMVTLNKTNTGSPQLCVSNVAINNWGRIIFHGKCEIHCSKINVYGGGILEFGNCCKVMHEVNITASTKVSIGDYSWIVHRCQVLDTNYHYIADLNKQIVSRMARPIVIGKYCWVCNSTTISGGAIIPNKTIVASNSLVNRDMSDIPENSIIGGVPAIFIKNGYRRVDSLKLHSSVSKFFRENPDALYYKFPFNCENGNCCNADIDK